MEVRSFWSSLEALSLAIQALNLTHHLLSHSPRRGETCCSEVFGKGGYWAPRRGRQTSHSSEEGFLVWWGDFQMGQVSGLQH